MDAVFRALADRNRRLLLDSLHARDGQTLNEMCQGLAMSRQAVSKHLAVLEKANLVVTRRDGREKFHYLNPVPIHDIGERWISKYEHPRLDALKDLKQRLEAKEDV
ncbi:MAG TPA: metalloregulator ArsR/SmtB family transcription factor [Acidobacteriaceae bacterium]|jgi:DNA-binding transcriptional ArsR family regulator